MTSVARTQRSGRQSGMQTIPCWLQQAFIDWLTGTLYLDGRGNYRSRIRARCVVVHNRELKRIYPSYEEFQGAAYPWLELWEAVAYCKSYEARHLALWPPQTAPAGR